MRLDVVGVLQLAHLALAEPADGGGQQPGHLGAERGRDLRRLGEQEVAGEDRLEVAPAGVDALDGAPGDRLVHHVVVVERAEVDELDRDAAHDRPRAGAARSSIGERRRRGQAKPGRSRLPPATDQVARPSR